MKYSYDDVRFVGFVSALDTVNASADASPGFVWRLETDDDDNSDAEIFGDENLLVNLSVWESLSHLRSFVRSEMHLAIMQRRREWFNVSTQAYVVLWWVRAGHVPTVAEAHAKLVHIRANGPGEFAFDFASHYPPPDAALSAELTSIQQRIRGYPQPIAGCDEQFNWLLAERDRVSVALGRMSINH